MNIELLCWALHWQERKFQYTFWLLNISSAFIDPVVFCISQTRATARLTQQVVDHMLNRTGYFSPEILSPDKAIVDRFKGCCFFPSRERLCASSCTESSVFIVLQSRSDPAHSVCSDCHPLDSESHDCRFSPWHQTNKSGKQHLS